MEPMFSILTTRQIISRKWCSLTLIKVPHRLADIFGKKSGIGTEVHIFGICELDKLWSAFNYFWTCEYILKYAIKYALYAKLYFDNVTGFRFIHCKADFHSD